jgi:hypothetical protein
MLLALRARSRIHRSLSDSAFTEGFEAEDMCTNTTQDAKTQLENPIVFLNCLDEFPCKVGRDALSHPHEIHTLRSCFKTLTEVRQGA